MRARRARKPESSPARAGSTLTDQASCAEASALSIISGRRVQTQLVSKSRLSASSQPSLLHVDRPAPRWRRRRRAASLQPVDIRPAGADRSSAALGRSMSEMPSMSTGCQWCPCVTKPSPCSFRAEYTSIARPVFTSWVVLSQMRSRTRRETLPTKTPAETSRSHRVRYPRSPTGHAERTRTIMRRLRRSQRRPSAVDAIRPRAERRSCPSARQRSWHRRRGPGGA